MIDIPQNMLLRDIVEHLINVGIDNVSAYKAKVLAEKNMVPVGIVMMGANGTRAIIDMGKVQWHQIDDQGDAPTAAEVDAAAVDSMSLTLAEIGFALLGEEDAKKLKSVKGLPDIARARVFEIELLNMQVAELKAALQFQARVQTFMLPCFGAEISADTKERNHRFYEESTELVQSNGMTCSEAHQLVDYTYNRPIGELFQEAGGVMVTLAALCTPLGLDMFEAGETELARILDPVIMDKVRRKQAAKPKHSPLPEHVPAVKIGARHDQRWQGCDHG